MAALAALALGWLTLFLLDISVFGWFDAKPSLGAHDALLIAGCAAGTVLLLAAAVVLWKASFRLTSPSSDRAPQRS